MELADLDKLSSAELRKLITLFARQTTLKNYKHVCDAQRKCSTCEKWFCYACYNWHLNVVHGPAIAQFNGKLDTLASLLQAERKGNEEKAIENGRVTKIRIKVKITQTEPRAPKPKPLTFEEIQQQIKDGIMSKEQLEKIIAKL